MAAAGLGVTERRDAWWLENLPVILILSAFGIYATLRAMEGGHYLWGPYLSPFYSPLIDPDHHFIPKWFSPALIILGVPLGFRTTCYYYRKAYYRAFFMDPPGCAIGEFKRNYTGEAKFPFVLQNLHRFFMVPSFFFLFFLWYDAFEAFFWNGQFGIGLGSLIMVVNVTMLSFYTLSCHSMRHIIGGNLDCFSCTKFGLIRKGVWNKITILNEKHMLFAWISLMTVGSTDLYICLVSRGIITDPRFL